MQKWYNNITKGQRIVLGVSFFSLVFIISAIAIKDVGGIIGLVLGAAPIIFFELGRRKF